MEKPGGQCTVVFAFIVTEPASGCVCGGGRPELEFLQSLWGLGTEEE
jgi:hypothetical protein